MTAYLVLENGTIFQGEMFGKPNEVTGEIVFSTGMNGYLETITDPCYHGQIILQTFPLIGNYGVISVDLENENVSAKAYICKYPCQEPSNFRSEEDLDTFFMRKGVVGLKGIDTRQLAKVLRENGSMNGKITLKMPTVKDQEEAREYRIEGAIGEVTCGKIQPLQNPGSRAVPRIDGEKSCPDPGSTKLSPHIAILDFGVTNSIINAFTSRGCSVTVFPYTATVDEILNANIDGILLSPGPGDPADPFNLPIIATIRQLQEESLPILGIGMGHQLLAMANGYKTKKLKSGHRGINQPVKEIATGHVYITAQNHGYTVIADNPSYVNVNDGTCEGLDYGNSFSVQFSPEHGPADTAFIFDRFIERTKNHATR